MLITNFYKSPDSTYFTTSDIEPELENGNTLKLTNGEGRRRSWGAPGVTSTVILETLDLVAIHIGFHHKHGGGQFYRYYAPTDPSGEAWEPLTWTQLDDDERQIILDAYEERAPGWAKLPGKLRQNYQKPVMQTRTTYKIVEIIDGRYFSVYKRETEYVIGKRLAERAIDDHGGGYYSYPSGEGVITRFEDGSLFPERFYTEPMHLALIECEISGTIIEYENGKLASTYLKPVREMRRFHYTPSAAEAVS